MGPAVVLIAVSSIVSSVSQTEAGDVERAFHHTIPTWTLLAVEPTLTIDEICDLSQALGCAVDIPPFDAWPRIQQRGLTISCAVPNPGEAADGSGPYPPFRISPSEEDLWPIQRRAIRDAIDRASEAKVPNCLVFTGFAVEGVDDAQAMKDWVEAYKPLAKYAGERNVILALEMLNDQSFAGSQGPMKGHPGYQGNGTPYCLELVRRVGSPHLGLAFDIYHVAVQGEDPVTAARFCAPWIKYVHTAGVPGRHELHRPDQRVDYPRVMRELERLGYRGFVSHEFLRSEATKDVLENYRRAIDLCEPSPRR